MTTRALEDQEIKLIFEEVSGCNLFRNRTMLICGIGMALRASELVGLCVGDVIDTNGNVKTYVTIRPETAKFNKERTIRIGSLLKNTIADFILYKRRNNESISKDAPLFRSNKSGHLTRQGLFDLLKRIFSKAGIDQSCHALRKTGATFYYIASDYDLIATQEFLGHADPSVTRRYIGLTTEQLREYSEKLSDYIFSAIENGKLNTTFNMSSFSVKEAISFLNKKGFEVNLRPIQSKQAQKKRKKAKVVNFPIHT